MIYLSQPNAGFLLLTRQLFSGRVSSLSALVGGWTRSKKFFGNFIITFQKIIAAGQTNFKFQTAKP